jgi:predicted TIM-barrel fold metal-dependent hydrolase
MLGDLGKRLTRDWVDRSNAGHPSRGGTVRSTPRDDRDDNTELPLPLGPCSNGEYEPVPLDPVAREAIWRVREGIDDHARRLQLPRRDFIRSVGGAALMLMTLGACHGEAKKSQGRRTGGTYRLPPESTTEPTVARDVLGGREVVVDSQTHFLEYDAMHTAGSRFPLGFPQASCGAGDPLTCFSVQHYLDNLFVRSDTTVAVLSAVPIPGESSPLSIDVMERARHAVDHACGDGHILLQGAVFPQLGRPGAALDGMSALAQQHRLVAWKVYTHSPRPGWSLDDHQRGAPRVGQAFLDRARETGIKTVCVHKGLGGGDASPVDVGPAAKANPDLRIVAYHSGYETGVSEGPYTEATANAGVNRLLKSVADAGIGPGGNIYAELGTTWWLLMRDPTQAAHVVGKLVARLGPDNVLWGTDSIWYGSPQDQIQAFRAFEISTELQERHGYPSLTPELKAKILGGNALKLYGVAAPADACRPTSEQIEQARIDMPAPHTTYGPETAAAVRELWRTHGVV